MTTSTGCDDCFMASTHVWPFYRAGCVGCEDRAKSEMGQTFERIPLPPNPVLIFKPRSYPRAGSNRPNMTRERIWFEDGSYEDRMNFHFPIGTAEIIPIRPAPVLGNPPPPSVPAKESQ